MKRYRNSEGVVAKLDDALAERLRGSGWVLVDGADDTAPPNPDPVTPDPGKEDPEIVSVENEASADDAAETVDVSEDSDSGVDSFDTDFTDEPEPAKAPVKRKPGRPKKVSE